MADHILVYIALFLWITICCEGEEVCHTYNTSNYGNSLVKNWHFQYPWPPLPADTTSFTLSIKGNNDAYVILSSTPGGNPNDYDEVGDVGTPKLVIGGYGNTKSAFSCVLYLINQEHREWQLFDTPDILNPDEARYFYFEFGDSTFRVGLEGNEPFINVNCSCCGRDTKYVGVATGWGGNAEWTYCGENECKDENVNCPWWANVGECDKNPSYMLRNCRLSCMVCEGTQQPANCQAHSTGNFGSVKVQNTHFQYPWSQLPSGATRFEVSIRGTRSAYIILSPTPGGIEDDERSDDGYPKILIGGFSYNPEKAESGYLCNSHQAFTDWYRVDTPNIPDQNLAKEFYIEFGGNTLAVGVVGEAPFINRSYSCSVNVKYFGVASGFGFGADWSYCGNYDVNPESVLDELLNKSRFGQKIRYCEENEQMCSEEASAFFKTWDEFIATIAGKIYSPGVYEGTHFDSYVFSTNNDDTSDTSMYAISNDISSYQYQLSIPSKAFAIDSLVVASVLKFDHPLMKSDGVLQSMQMGSKLLSIIAVDKIFKHTVPLKTDEMFYVSYKLSFAVEAGMNISCQYITSTGDWSDDGCWVINSNETHVTCGYDHITSFAVLMQVADIGELPSIHVKILSYLSYITMSISMICLVAANCIYIISKLYKKTRIALHMNLAVALFAAQLLFLTGIDSKNKNSCIAVTVLLHCLWLVVFVWMLIEGINLFLKVNPNINMKMKLSICMPIAWGIPLVIALITLSVRIEDYARGGEKCWLPIEGGVIWAFAAFALIITCVNIVFLVITIYKFLALKTNMDKSKAARLKASLRAIAILAPILGVTWIFAFLQFDQTSSIVFSYLFTIGNGLQGLFVFIAQCLLDEDVRTFLRQKTGRGAVEQNPPTQETNN